MRKRTKTVRMNLSRLHQDPKVPRIILKIQMILGMKVGKMLFELEG